MENTQIIAERIKIQAKDKGISVKKLLEKCGLGVNTVNKMANGTDIVSQNLLKIAEELECSVDYLCGRTDSPLIGENQISTGDIKGNHNANMNIRYAPKKENKDSNDIMTQFMEAFSDLPFENKVAALNFILEMKKST